MKWARSSTIAWSKTEGDREARHSSAARDLAVFLGSAASDGITGSCSARSGIHGRTWPVIVDDLEQKRRLHPPPDSSKGPRVDLGGSNERPGVAIVGCGLIGHKRAAALGSARLVACADIAARARRRAGPRRMWAPSRWIAGRLQSHHPDVGVVIVATTNDALDACGGRPPSRPGSMCSSRSLRRVPLQRSIG